MAQAGLSKLPSVQNSVLVRRYEKERPGELLHLDMKKLGCFEHPGHRVKGDRTRSTRRACWQAMHVAIDDHPRVGFSRVLRDETSHSACNFLIAALRYYRELGVPIQAVMTYNGSATSPSASPSCCAGWASSTIARTPTRRSLTAKTNASFKRFCVNGPMFTAMPAQTCAPLNCNPGSSTTTFIVHTPPCPANRLPPDSALTGTTS